jgi:hypothetical protein
MNTEYLFDKEGSDSEVARLEGLLSEFRINPVPPSLSGAKTEQQRSIFSRYKLAFAVSFASLLVVFLAIGVLVSRLTNRQLPERVELGSGVTNQELRNDQNVIVQSPVSEVDPTQIVERAAKIKTSPRRIRRAQTATVAERAKDGTRLTPEELYAYQKLKVALFLAGSKMKIVQDTIDQVDDERKGKDER